MKSYAGNWQINRNSRNRMSQKILSERIPLNGQWNNRTSQTWPETRHGREGRSRTSFFLQNWRNQMTEQYRSIGPEIQGFLSDRWSFYRTCPSVRRYFVFTATCTLHFLYFLFNIIHFSSCIFFIQQVHFISCIFLFNRYTSFPVCASRRSFYSRCTYRLWNEPWTS